MLDQSRERMDPAINIGPRERLKRLVMGIASLVASAVLIFVFIGYDAPRMARVLVFLPLWMASLGLFQARESTCIALASRGTCNMDSGEQAIDDERVIDRLRLQARRIHRRALIMATVLTVAVVAFP